MRKHEPVLPPDFIYPIDDWRWVETRVRPGVPGPGRNDVYHLQRLPRHARRRSRKAAPSFLHGTFVNGFYETWPIPYGEKAFGFAKTGQTMVNVPDGKIIRLYVDDEPFTSRPRHAAATSGPWTCGPARSTARCSGRRPPASRCSLESRRLVSFTERHVAAISYEVTVLNAAAALVIVVGDRAQHPPDGGGRSEDDPRLARTGSRAGARPPADGRGRTARVIIGYLTARSRMRSAAAWTTSSRRSAPRTLKTACPRHTAARSSSPSTPSPASRSALTKYLTYHTSRSDKPGGTAPCARAARSTAPSARLRARSRPTSALHGRLLAPQRHPGQRRTHPRLQQCLRWNLFQLLQATGRVENAGVPAKGLTGQAYEGHYFWDMEIYVLPVPDLHRPRGSPGTC